MQGNNRTIFGGRQHGHETTRSSVQAKERKIDRVDEMEKLMLMNQGYGLKG